MIDDDSETAALLGQLKVQPSAEARARAFAKVSAEFHAAAAPARASSSTRPFLRRSALAAAALLAVAGVWTWKSMQPGALVAKLEALDGALSSRSAHWFNTQKYPQEGAALTAGDSLTVSNDGGALLRLSPSLTVRLAAGTQARLVAADEIELNVGEAFVDAVPGAAAALRIVTPQGVVTHLGTQYLVRAQAGEIEVSVREGRAQLKTGKGTSVAAAGEWLLQRDSSGGIQTGKLARDDVRFDWIGELPSDFHLEGATLSEFLAWFQRETGSIPIYSSSVDTGNFAHVQLKGSIDDLQPFEALSYVLATADLAWHREGAKVIIEKRPVPSS
jgi:ferric-dicitrate binding protein FerR (iron transport regulator)